MYEKVLIPLDGSKLAEVALPYAEELAKNLGSEITVIGVEESRATDSLGDIPEPNQKGIKPAKFGIEKYLEELIVEANNVNTASLVGHPAETIIDYSDKNNIDLIVMATHGRSGIMRWAMGSVTDKVIRGTKKAVMLIRTKNGLPEMRKKGMIKKILVPLDGSSESEAIIPYVEQLAYELKAEIILFQSLEPPPTFLAVGVTAMITPFSYEDAEPILASIQQYLNNVGEKLGEKGIATKSQVRIGKASEEIITLADEIDADLVAMSTHGRSGISRWTFGSVADKVLRRGNTPLLLVRTEASEENASN